MPIAIHEWHPFTISSAPEDPNYFSVHIRGVGHWTNKVFQHFKSSQVGDDLEMNGKQIEVGKASSGRTHGTIGVLLN